MFTINHTLFLHNYWSWNHLSFLPPTLLQELKAWGIKTSSHRRKIITNQDSVIKREESLSTPSSVEQDGCSPPLFTSQSPPPHAHQIMTRQLSRQLSHASQNSGSQNSQLSTCSSSTAAYSQSFEVVQIQLTKKISNSSSGSSSSQNNWRRWAGTWILDRTVDNFLVLSLMRLYCVLLYFSQILNIYNDLCITNHYKWDYNCVVCLQDISH